MASYRIPLSLEVDCMDFAYLHNIGYCFYEQWATDVLCNSAHTLCDLTKEYPRLKAIASYEYPFDCRRWSEPGIQPHSNSLTKQSDCNKELLTIQPDLPIVLLVNGLDRRKGTTIYPDILTKL